MIGEHNDQTNQNIFSIVSQKSFVYITYTFENGTIILCIILITNCNFYKEFKTKESYLQTTNLKKIKKSFKLKLKLQLFKGLNNEQIMHMQLTFLTLLI